MNYEKGHDTWEMNAVTTSIIKELCPRCHRKKYLGVCGDGCRMCQSCYQKVHGDFEGLPSDKM